MLSANLSRRSLLGLGVGLGTTLLTSDCDITTPPDSSPFLLGPYRAAEFVLGERPGTEALPQFMDPSEFSIPLNRYYYACPDGVPTFPEQLPSRILASVYVPRHQPNVRDHRVPSPNPLKLPKGPFPILLYAHGVRSLQFACGGPHPPGRDFTRIHRMLEHVAGYGCVAVVPDLSWVPPDFDNATLKEAFTLRARVLVAYYQHLVVLNQSLFAGQLDISRVILAGHSTGAGACATAGRTLSPIVSPAHAFIAPYFRDLNPPPRVGADTRNLLVIAGGADDIVGSSPADSFTAAGGPKTLVTIPGANHFGYTHLCGLDNTCDRTVGSDGEIPREGQQKATAAYLAALMRSYAHDDDTVLPYLTGERIVEGPEIFGVTGIEVQYQG